MDVFRFVDYRKYIKKYIESLPNRGRGQRSSMADAMGINTGYISQVLSGSAHFSQEQAHSLSEYLKHSDSESEYLLLLLNYSRAGTPKLKQFYKNRIKVFQNKELQLKEKFKIPSSISELDTIKYFSLIDNSLIHLLLTIPQYANKEALIKKTAMSTQKVNEILSFLVQCGLIRKETSGTYKVTEQALHLPEDSAVINIYHTQRRLQALDSLNSHSAFNLHYSSNITISRDDFIKIKQSLVEAIEKNKQRIRESESEILCGLCIDFYEVN